MKLLYSYSNLHLCETVYPIFGLDTLSTVFPPPLKSDDQMPAPLKMGKNNDFWPIFALFRGIFVNVSLPPPPPPSPLD